MKKLLLFVFLIISSAAMIAQESLNLSLEHDGLTRQYSAYIPSGYSADSPIPMVLNFHGFGSNAFEQLFYSGFNNVAENNNFIVVYPQGTTLDLGGGNTSTHFNVGGFTTGSTVDDIGFAAAIIDTMAAEFNINTDRVYSTGMSNGGYMSFLLACQLSEKIAAVASVTGSMSPSTYDNCDPQHPMPIMQIHGTNDATVPYEGDIWTRSIDDVMDYWVDFNNCNEEPVEIAVPDTNMDDGSTATRFVYENGDLGVTAEHYRIEDGGHTWPGTSILLPGLNTNLDFNASERIWEFFSQYDLNGPITTSTESVLVRSLKISPNPTQNFIQVEGDITSPTNYQVVSMMGIIQAEGVLQSSNQRIDLSNLPANMYFLKVGNQTYKVLKTR